MPQGIRPANEKKETKNPGGEEEALKKSKGHVGGMGPSTLQVWREVSGAEAEDPRRHRVGDMVEESQNGPHGWSQACTLLSRSGLCPKLHTHLVN